jgi:hypothetical protein
LKCDVGDLVRIADKDVITAYLDAVSSVCVSRARLGALKISGQYRRVSSRTNDDFYTLEGEDWQCVDAVFSERWVPVTVYEAIPLLCTGTELRDENGIGVRLDIDRRAYRYYSYPPNACRIPDTHEFKQLFKCAFATEEPEPRVAKVTRWEQVCWAASRDAIGWLVKEKVPGALESACWRLHWLPPQSISYHSGAQYARARINETGNGVNESTIEVVEITDD